MKHCLSVLEIGNGHLDFGGLNGHAHGGSGLSTSALLLMTRNQRGKGSSEKFGVVVESTIVSTQFRARSQEFIFTGTQWSRRWIHRRYLVS